MPSASNDDDIVFAVYMPPHAPTSGTRCARCRRSLPSTSCPRVNAPTASNGDTIVSACPSSAGLDRAA
jgi:hypothetical protein